MTLLLHLENAFTAPLADGESKELLFRHISLVFRVLVVSMRYEPGNAKYFLAEVRPSILVSILRGMGCFSHSVRVDTSHTQAWDQLADIDAIRPKLQAIHEIFKSGESVIDGREDGGAPPAIFASIYLLRLLFDLAKDNFDK